MTLDIKGLGNSLRREPLAHFIAAGALLFVIESVWSSMWTLGAPALS